MLKNKKGFTLVELLVAITILGVIIALAIPLIRNVQGNQGKQKYNTYRSSIEQSARLYVDTYGEDEFGNNEEGCILIPLEDLIEKDLAKDIQVDNTSCNTTNSFVKVEKKGKRYTYETYLSCGEVDGTTGNIAADTLMTDTGADFDSQSDSCNTGHKDSTNMDIVFAPTYSQAINMKRVTINIKVTSATGINKNSKLSYAFTTSNNTTTAKWNTLSIDLAENGKEATAVVLTPEKVTGEYYLHVNTKNLSDSKATPAEVKITSGDGKCTKTGKIITCGTYIVDNEVPKFNNSNPLSAGDNFSDSKLSFKVTDDKYTTNTSLGGSKDKLRLCLELNTSNKKCAKNPNKVEENELEYREFSAIKEGEDAKLNSYLTGSDNTEGITSAKITIADMAGNTKSENYPINKLTYDFYNGGEGCTFKYAFKGIKWGKLCTPSRGNGYTFLGWNTKKDGSGTTITNDTTANDNTTAYAQWNKKISELTIEFNPPEYFYDGKEKKPSIVLKDGNVTLTKDADYTVSYKDNINAGTAQIIITGTRKYNDKTHTFYSDSASKEFTIKKRIVTVTHASVVEKRLEYNGKDQNLLKNAGSCTTGGKMYWYSSNATSSSAAPTFSANNGWTATKPNEYTKKNAGTYYIYYYCYISDTNNNEGEDTNIVKSVSKTIEKKPTTLSINPTNATLIYETNGTSTITTDGDGALSCKSSDESVAKCSINGKTLTIIPQKNTADGKTATITINQAEGNNYLAASTTYSATVNRKTLTCPKSPSDQTYAKKVLGSNIKCPTGSTEGGTTSATDADTYTQTCTANSGYKFATACSVTWKIVRASAGLKLDPTSGDLIYETNGTSTITTNSDGALSCTSSNENIAKCTINGKTLTIIPQKNTADNKTATITVSQGETKNYLSGSKTYSATVNRKTLTCPNSPRAQTYDGNTKESGITCPQGSTAGGTTSATNANTYTQTCTANSGYKFATACSVTWEIKKAQPTISLNPTSGTLTYGTNGTSTITTNSDGTLSCKSSDESVATCSVSGKTLTIIPQKNKADGKTATITVNQGVGTNYLAGSTTYSATVNRKTLTCPSSPSAKTYDGNIKESGITCPQGSTAGETTSATNANTYTQTCTANSGYKFATACSVTWEIKKAQPTISLNPTSGTLTYGTNGTSTITTNSDGTLSCKSSDESVATCSVSGKTLTIIPQKNKADGKTATITVNQGVGTNYLAGSTTYSATVNRKTLTCPSSPSNKEYTGNEINSGITCPTGSTADETTSATDEGTYYQKCIATSGYKFSNACRVSWIIELVNYSITYDLKGGSVTGNPNSYNMKSNNITLNNPTRTGYTFTGWTGSNGNTPQKSVTIAKGSSGDKTYTANWSINTLTIYYKASKGSLTSGSQSRGYSIESSTKRIKKDGSYLKTVANYGGELPDTGLDNYNNSSYLEVTYTDSSNTYVGVKFKEWKCVSGCTTSTVYYNQGSKDSCIKNCDDANDENEDDVKFAGYKASDFCDLSNGSCTVEVDINWAQKINDWRCSKDNNHDYYVDYCLIDQAGSLNENYCHYSKDGYFKGTNKDATVDETDDHVLRSDLVSGTSCFTDTRPQNTDAGNRCTRNLQTSQYSENQIFVVNSCSGARCKNSSGSIILRKNLRMANVVPSYCTSYSSGSSQCTSWGCPSGYTYSNGTCRKSITRGPYKTQSMCWNNCSDGRCAYGDSGSTPAKPYVCLTATYTSRICTNSSWVEGSCNGWSGTQYKCN